MAIPFHKDITSLTALRDTVLTDNYAYRWFTYLVTQPVVRQTYFDQPEFSQLFDHLRKILTQQGVATVLLLIVLVTLFLTKHLGFAIAVLAFFLFYFKTLTDKRKVIADITVVLIKQDFEEAVLNKKSLYQISEFYFRKYNVFSLVDAIYSLDQIYRAVALVVAFILFFVYPIWASWYGLVLGLFVYVLLHGLTNLAFFYNRLK